MPALALTSGQAAKLRAAAQTLPIRLAVGKAGVTPTFVLELDTALAKHGTVKVRLPGERPERTALATELASATGAGHAGGVGAVAVFYRPLPATQRA